METVTKFLDRFCEFGSGGLTWFADCTETYDGYCRWCRLELKRVPESKAAFWDAIKDRVTVYEGPRGTFHVKQFIGMRFLGYYPKKDASLGSGFRFTRWRGPR